jgi:DNA-binding IclR family transcriptional regulator
MSDSALAPLTDPRVTPLPLPALAPPAAAPALAAPVAAPALVPTTARGGRPARGEPLLDRAFRILTAFGPDHRALSLTALSLRAGLPKASALRISRKLVEWHALERTDSGEYVIGLRLLEVASLAPRGHGLRSTALPYLEDLHHSTGQHVLLAVRDGLEAILVERLSARRADRVLYRVGGRMPLHSTGVGLVLLANAPWQVQDEVLASDLLVEPEGSWLSAASLRVKLAEVRREGVAIASRPTPELMTSVAAPITDHSGATVAAISVVTRSGHLDPAVLRPAVVAIARAISRAVAGSSPTADSRASPSNDAGPEPAETTA